jgi:polysaccharide transporter, PST family
LNLVKTSVLNGIAVLIKLLTALGLNKLLAVYVGPAGYAVIGQFQNAVGMIGALANAGLTTGVTKYTAEYYDDEERQRGVWRTAGSITCAGSLLASLAIALCHKLLARLFFKSETYADVFLWLAATLSLLAANGLLLAILNGKKEIRRYVTVNIAGSLLSLVLTALLARAWGLYGALVALAVNQSVVLLVTLAICRRATWFRLSHLVGRIDPALARNLAKFMLIALTTAVAGPTAQIVVRDHLATSFGWGSAGNWQAVTRISDIYLLLATTTLSVYYLPRLSEIREAGELKREIVQGYKVILPVAACGAAVIYLLREWIAVTLFTREFSAMGELFGWQLTGDVVKIASWMLGYVLIGRAMTKAVIVTEILFSASFVALTMSLTPYLGLKGVTVAFLVNYVLHFFAMGYCVSSYFKSGMGEHVSNTAQDILPAASGDGSET